MKQMLIDLVIMAIIVLAVHNLWIGLELAFYGEIQPRVVDDIIGFLLYSSIYLNYKIIKSRIHIYFIKAKKEEE